MKFDFCRCSSSLGQFTNNLVWSFSANDVIQHTIHNTMEHNSVKWQNTMAGALEFELKMKLMTMTTPRKSQKLRIDIILNTENRESDCKTGYVRFLQNF